ncbi:MAG: nucleotide exchange factor GrpE [Thermoanaerobaculales bacterium]|nr:nucleotide exchange factor GrpE [Thermoanaerobaculales bacterium]
MSDDFQTDETVVEEPAGTPSPLLIDLPEAPEEAVPVLIEALAEIKLLLDARTEDLQRVAAEFDNFRKRVLRDRDDLMLRANQRLVEALLPVLDSFGSALDHEARTAGEEALLGGVDSTYQQLLDVLAKEGLETIPAAGEPFDPNLHEAVMGGGAGDLIVTAELRPGYTLGGRVIRPSMVGVADGETTEEG